MENTELVKFIAKMFADYFSYMMPLAGFLAGTHIVLSWFYDIAFRPFKRL